MLPLVPRCDTAYVQGLLCSPGCKASLSALGFGCVAALHNATQSGGASVATSSLSMAAFKLFDWCFLDGQVPAAVLVQAQSGAAVAAVPAALVAAALAAALAAL